MLQNDQSSELQESRRGSMATDVIGDVPALIGPESRTVIAYVIDGWQTAIVPAPANRRWMDELPSAFANRCLPLRIANQAGWFIFNTHEIEISWNGGPGIADVRIKNLDAECNTPTWAASHFGHGIVSWLFPIIFRTPLGYNLNVRGPANFFKDGIYPLDGIVETDWATATFTMNWKVTRIGHPIRFGAGEPICMIVPQKRGDIESFSPELRTLDEAPELKIAHNEWRKSRAQFLKALEDDEIQGPEYQKHYFKGMRVDGASPFPRHQARLLVRSFQDLRPLGGGKENPGMLLPKEEHEENAGIRHSFDKHPLGDPIATASLLSIREADFFHLAFEARDRVAEYLRRDPVLMQTPRRYCVWDYRVSESEVLLAADARLILPPGLLDAFLERVTAWNASHLGLKYFSIPEILVLARQHRRSVGIGSAGQRYRYLLRLDSQGVEDICNDVLIVSGKEDSNESAKDEPTSSAVSLKFNECIVFDDRMPHGINSVSRTEQLTGANIFLEGFLCDDR